MASHLGRRVHLGREESVDRSIPTVVIGRFRSTYTSPFVQPTGGRRMEGIVAIEEVVPGQVFTGRRTSLRAGSASQVFASSRTASEDKDAGHGPEGNASVGHAFKTDLPHKSSLSIPTDAGRSRQHRSRS